MEAPRLPESIVLDGLRIGVAGRCLSRLSKAQQRLLEQALQPVRLISTAPQHDAHAHELAWCYIARRTMASAVGEMLVVAITDPQRHLLRLHASELDSVRLHAGLSSRVLIHAQFARLGAAHGDDLSAGAGHRTVLGGFRFE